MVQGIIFKKLLKTLLFKEDHRPLHFSLFVALDKSVCQMHKM